MRILLLILCAFTAVAATAFSSPSLAFQQQHVVDGGFYYRRDDDAALIPKSRLPCRRHAQQLQQSERRRRYFGLAASSSESDEGGGSQKKARIRFSAFNDESSESTSSTTGGIDSFVSLFTSDLGSIVLGVLGLTILVIGRTILSDGSDIDLETPEELGQETRANILAVLACSAVLVNGVSKLNVESALAETVTLQGVPILKNENDDQQTSGDQPAVRIFSDASLLVGEEQDSRRRAAIEWTLSSLLVATPAISAVLLQLQNDDESWNIVAGGGILPSTIVLSLSPDSIEPLDAATTPILNRFQQTTATSGSTLSGETYLPTLQALPGRIEFQSYLPENTQSVLILPVVVSSANMVLVVLGGNQARSFTPRSIAWCRTVSERLGQQLTK